jgi:hypothetical protein
MKDTGDSGGRGIEVKQVEEEQKKRKSCLKRD